MIPIYEEKADGAAGYTFREFRNRFLQICAEHQRDGRALAFAFLLFDVDSPELLKMLRDSDYWHALDQVSGRFLSVFTLLARAPKSDYRQERRGMSGVGPVHDPGMKVQLMLNTYFGLDGKIDFPAILLFQVEDGKLSGYCIVQLVANSVEGTFSEVRELLRDLTDALSSAGAKGRTDPQSSFEAIQSRIRKRKVVRVVKNGLKVLSELKDIAGLAGGLV